MKPIHQAKFIVAGRSALAMFALAAGALTASAQSVSSSDASSRDVLTEADQAARTFIHEATTAGRKEVRLSQLALERTTNADVRNFAQMIIDDHQVANARLAAIANIKGIMIALDTASASMRMDDDADDTSNPSRNVADHDPRKGSERVSTESADLRDGATTALERKIETAVENLSKQTGDEFDRRYVDLMIEGHQHAIDLFEDEAQELVDPQLNSFAQQTLPTLREHLEKARSLRQELRNG